MSLHDVGVIIVRTTIFAGVFYEAHEADTTDGDAEAEEDQKGDESLICGNHLVVGLRCSGSRDRCFIIIVLRAEQFCNLLAFGFFGNQGRLFNQVGHLFDKIVLVIHALNYSLNFSTDNLFVALKQRQVLNLDFSTFIFLRHLCIPD